MSYEVGDKVKVTIRGTVRSKHEHNSCDFIEDTDGYAHYVYLTAAFSEGGLKVKRLGEPKPEFEVGEPYIDADGDVLIRTEDGWMVVGGSHEYPNDHASRPVVKLVPESEVR